MLGLKAKLEFWDLMLQGSGKMFHQQSVLASGAGAPVENRMAFNEPFTALPGPRLSPSHLGTRQQPPSGQRDTNKEPSTRRDSHFGCDWPLGGVAVGRCVIEEFQPPQPSCAGVNPKPAKPKEPKLPNPALEKYGARESQSTART